MTEKASSWLVRAAVVALVGGCLTFVAAGLTLSERVTNIRTTQVRVLAEKADKVYVDAKFDAILREILVTQNMVRDHATQTARAR